VVKVSTARRKVVVPVDGAAPKVDEWEQAVLAAEE